MVKSNIVIRILGNNLKYLHSSNQTIDNLKFTLQNEPEFEDTDKIYILNRIVDKVIKQKIISLLNDNNMPYIDIPLNLDKYLKIPKLDINEKDILNMTWNDVKYITMKMYKHNLFLIANNETRNYAINYGKKKGYKWIYVLDSNSFLRKIDFDLIIKNILPDTDYLALPQRRLLDNNLNNNTVNNSDFDISKLPEQEPQLVFKNTSKEIFNEELPYGCIPKAELINALGIPGKWNQWNECFPYFKKRHFKNIKWQKLSNIIRLNPGNKKNDVKNNWKYRYIGLYYLIREVDKLVNV